jgi:hypothetical protein
VGVQASPAVVPGHPARAAEEVSGRPAALHPLQVTATAALLWDGGVGPVAGTP